MTQPKQKDYRLDWEKRFDEKFSNEIFPAVVIQLKQFIGEEKVKAVGRGFSKGRLMLEKSLQPNKQELETIARDIQDIINESKATFFINKGEEDIEIPCNEIIYELRAEISNNISMYFYNKLKDLK